MIYSTHLWWMFHCFPYAHKKGVEKLEIALKTCLICQASLGFCGPFAPGSASKS